MNYVDQDTTLEEIIEMAIDTVKSNKTSFTAFDVTKEVHELVRHKNIKDLVHTIIKSDSNIRQVGPNCIVDGKPVQAINYECIAKQNSTPDRIVVSIPNLSDGDIIYLMDLYHEDKMVLFRKLFYDDFKGGGTIEGQYEVKNGKISIGRNHITGKFPNGYDVYVDGDEIYFEEA